MRIAESDRPVLPGPARHLQPSGADGRARTAARAEIRDVASIMGIPIAEVSPLVRTEITRLMSEIDSLRATVGIQQVRIAQLEQLADQDALAPIVNRRAFVRELSRAVSLNRRYGTNSCVIYFDLNGLKAINDTFGHAAGDAAILQVAETLRQNVRESDLVGRLGGDEFGVLMSQAAAGAAEEKAAALSETVERAPLEWAGSVIPLRLAYGIHVIDSGEDASDALAAADMAMYAHKRRA